LNLPDMPKKKDRNRGEEVNGYIVIVNYENAEWETEGEPKTARTGSDPNTPNRRGVQKNGGGAQKGEKKERLFQNKGKKKGKKGFLNSTG